MSEIPVPADLAPALVLPFPEERYQAAMAVLRNPKQSSGGLILVLSLAAFVLLQKDSSPLAVAVLVGVLLFHELGHYAGMRVFGYQDVRMFFIPFLGAAVSKTRSRLPPTSILTNQAGSGVTQHGRGLIFLTVMLPMRATVVAVVLFACACAGKSPEPARPTGGAEPSVTGTPPGGGTPPSDKPSGKPVGTKLVQDAADSPKVFKLGANDGSGHGLGKASLTVDGRNVWPPEGPGCPELIRCCTALVALDESLALACLLAVGRDPDCPTALRTSVAIAGESGVAIPAACPR
jgi:hypothetical protein